MHQAQSLDATVTGPEGVPAFVSQSSPPLQFPVTQEPVLSAKKVQA